MKNKGFTLAELLGVIVLLALICLVAFPPILRDIKKSKSNIDEATFKIIRSATDVYVNRHLSSFEKVEDNVYCVQLQSLIDEGDLSMDLKDTNTNMKIDPLKYVKVVVKANKYNYSMAKQGEC